MIAVIMATAAVTSVVTMVLTRIFLVRQIRSWPVTPKERRLLDRTMSLMFRLLNPTEIDNAALLPEKSRDEIQKLLNTYEKEVK